MRLVDQPVDALSATNQTVSLSIPAKPEYVLLARLALSAVCRLSQLDEEDTSDLKLAITEAASTTMAPQGDPDRRLEFSFRVGSDRLEVDVADPAPPGQSARDPAQEQFSQAIMHAVVDVCEIQGFGPGQLIRLVKYLPPQSDRDPEGHDH